MDLPEPLTALLLEAAQQLTPLQIADVTLLGGGQVEEIAEMGRDLEVDLLIVDASLTAIQQRNLEERTGLKTIDRTGLILEIFGERAATAEGRLQVELAPGTRQQGLEMLEQRRHDELEAVTTGPV